MRWVADEACLWLERNRCDRNMLAGVTKSSYARDRRTEAKHRRSTLHTRTKRATLSLIQLEGRQRRGVLGQ